MQRREFIDHCLELLHPLGTLHAKRMFGGHGVYLDGLFMAIVADERLFLKADAPTRMHFEAAGCEPFVYRARGKLVKMNYWSAPAESMESTAQMHFWGRLALAAAVRAQSVAPQTTRRKRATMHP